MFPAARPNFSSKKNSLRGQNKDVQKEIDKVKEKRIERDGEDALRYAEDALEELDYLRTKLSRLSEKDASPSVRAEIEAQIDQIEQQLEFAKSQLGKELEADSDEVVIAMDDAAVVSGLENALSILGEQYAYIDQLAKQDDGSGEWVNNGEKIGILSDVEYIEYQVTNALDYYNYDWNQWALDEIRDALDDLDELDEDVDGLGNNKIVPPLVITF